MRVPAVRTPKLVVPVAIVTLVASCFGIRTAGTLIAARSSIE